MRHFRFFAGLLTLSLISTVVLGDFFHVQNRVGAKESNHLVAHSDAAHIDEASDSLGSGAADGECHIRSSEVTIASHAGQRLVVSEVAGAMPIVFAAATGCEHIAYNALIRKTPLFEHASLFAKTISIRV